VTCLPWTHRWAEAERIGLVSVQRCSKCLKTRIKLLKETP
jgi:hypothetical protein